MDRTRGPASLLLHPYLVEQVRRIDELDHDVRRGVPGGIHGTRKACRRLRAVLAAYRPLLDRSQTDPLRDELRWFARSLSEARDHEVVAARLGALVDEEPEELVARPVRARLDEFATAGRIVSQYTVDEALGSDRYQDLRSALDRLAVAPPWTAEAARPAHDVVLHRLHREWKRVRRHRKAAHDPHEVRKAVKRLRHGFEVAEPAWGMAAEAPRRAAADLAAVLGDRQDTVLARAALLAVWHAAAGAGEDTFTYGRLHAAEDRREADLLAEADLAWRVLRKAVRSASW